MHLPNARHLFPISTGADDVAILTSTMSFDAHVLQLFPTLMVGASLILASPKGHLDPGYIVELVIHHQITEFIFSVPTMVRLTLYIV